VILGMKHDQALEKADETLTELSRIINALAARPPAGT
jgi:hypothetical protein